LLLHRQLLALAVGQGRQRVTCFLIDLIQLPRTLASTNTLAKSNGAVNNAEIFGVVNKSAARINLGIDAYPELDIRLDCRWTRQIRSLRLNAARGTERRYDEPNPPHNHYDPDKRRRPVEGKEIMSIRPEMPGPRSRSSAPATISRHEEHYGILSFFYNEL
jgi:hypothetical protein